MNEHAAQFSNTAFEHLQLARDIGIANMTLLAGPCESALEQSVNTAQDLQASARHDISEGTGTKLKASLVGAAIISETTIGNELVTITFASTVTEMAKDLQPTGRPVLDTMASTALVVGTVLPFSYFQQLAYGRVTRYGSKHFKETISTVASLTDRQIDEEVESNKPNKTDGAEALAIGTSFAYLRHKAKNPNSSDEEEKRVIRKGAQVIAGFWAGLWGVAAAFSSGAEKVESSPIIQTVGSITSLPNLALIGGGLYTANEWRKLLVKPKALNLDMIETDNLSEDQAQIDNSPLTLSD